MAIGTLSGFANTRAGTSLRYLNALDATNSQVQRLRQVIRKRLTKALAGLVIEWETDVFKLIRDQERAIAALGDTTTFMSDFEEVVKKSHRQLWGKKDGWRPLSSMTLAITGGGGGKSRLMEETGTLREAIEGGSGSHFKFSRIGLRWDFSFRVTVPHAKYHTWGARGSPKSTVLTPLTQKSRAFFAAKHGLYFSKEKRFFVNVPIEREIFGLSDQDVDDLCDKAVDRLMTILNGAGRGLAIHGGFAVAGFNAKNAQFKGGIVTIASRLGTGDVAPGLTGFISR